MPNSPCLDRRNDVGALPRSDFRDVLTNQSPKNGLQPCRDHPMARRVPPKLASAAELVARLKDEAGVI